jgi:hypothetical protein
MYPKKKLPERIGEFLFTTYELASCVAVGMSHVPGPNVPSKYVWLSSAQPLRSTADLPSEKEPEKKEIGFGSQIRTYTFQPYMLVKDHRTAVESGDVQAVMDGELDEFVEGYLKFANEVGKRP